MSAKLLQRNKLKSLKVAKSKDDDGGVVDGSIIIIIIIMDINFTVIRNRKLKHSVDAVSGGECCD